MRIFLIVRDQAGADIALQDALTQDPHAEVAHIEALNDAVHDPTVCSLRAPLGQGVLMTWIKLMVSLPRGFPQEMRADGPCPIKLHAGEMSLAEVNSLLSIQAGCSDACKVTTLTAVVGLPKQKDAIADCLVSADLSQDILAVQAKIPGSAFLADAAGQEGSVGLLAPPPLHPVDVPQGSSRTLVISSAHVLLSQPKGENIKTRCHSSFECTAPGADDQDESNVDSSDTSQDSCDDHILPIIAAGTNPSALLRGGNILAASNAQASPLPATLPQRTQSPVIGMREFVPVAQLGRGGFGTVFMVRHVPSGALCALKAIPRMPQRDQVIQTEEVQRREIRRTKMAIEEQLAMRRCEGVTGIVQLLGSFMDSRHFYFVMVSACLVAFDVFAD